MIALVRHPSSPADAVHVSALAERDARGGLCLRWRFRGVGGVRVPPPDTVRRGERLWEHTCAEAFVAADDRPGYIELNVSPARAWAVYAFAAYRERIPLDAPGLSPDVAVERDDDDLAIDVRLGLAALGPAYERSALRIALTAVVETTDGRLSYWALRHPTATPDFHHTDGFALRLPAPVRST